MVPMQTLSLKQNVGDDGEDDERDTLLHHLQLYQRERPAVAFETNAVGWNLTAVLEEGDAPLKGNNGNEGPVATGSRLL